MVTRRGLVGHHMESKMTKGARPSRGRYSVQYDTVQYCSRWAASQLLSFSASCTWRVDAAGDSMSGASCQLIVEVRQPKKRPWYAQKEHTYVVRATAARLANLTPMLPILSNSTRHHLHLHLLLLVRYSLNFGRPSGSHPPSIRLHLSSLISCCSCHPHSHPLYRCKLTSPPLPLISPFRLFNRRTGIVVPESASANQSGSMVTQPGEISSMLHLPCRW